MKKIIIILIVTVFAGCRALDKLTMFDLKYDYNFTLPKNSLVNVPVDINSPEVSTDTEKQFEVNNTNKNLIEGIKLKELTLQIENPGHTFRFLKTVSVYLKAEGLPEILIAEKEVIPDDIGNLLQMDVTNSELSEYLKKEKISMRVKTVADEEVTEDLRIKLHSVFRVDAKILGI